MNATSLYVAASQVVCRLSFEDNYEEIVLELNSLMPKLRIALSCAVCRSLVNDPYIICNRVCDHNVCRECLNGRKVLQPPCENCDSARDYKSYDENTEASSLLPCYRSLCEYIASSSVFSLLSDIPIKNEIESIPTVVLWNMSPQSIVAEGAQTDEFSAFSIDISMDSSVEALAAATIEATNRLKQYRRETNPDEEVSDDEEIPKYADIKFEDYNGYHTEDTADHEGDDDESVDQKDSTLTNGFGPDSPTGLVNGATSSFERRGSRSRSVSPGHTPPLIPEHHQNGDSHHPHLANGTYTTNGSPTYNDTMPNGSENNYSSNEGYMINGYGNNYAYMNGDAADPNMQNNYYMNNYAEMMPYDEYYNPNYASPPYRDYAMTEIDQNIENNYQTNGTDNDDVGLPNGFHEPQNGPVHTNGTEFELDQENTAPNSEQTNGLEQTEASVAEVPNGDTNETAN